MIIIYLIALAFLLYWVTKTFYIVKVDNTLMFTGAPGTGKTLEMVTQAVKLLKHNRRSVKFANFKIKIYNLLREKKKKIPLFEIPMMYSNIPIKISKNEMSLRLNMSHLLLTERLNYKSVVVITELGKVVSRYEHKNPNIADNINEFVSLYRHYTKGGYFLCDDQSSDNAEVDIRRRLGSIINMLHFRKFWFVYWVKMRTLTISEDIKTIENDNVEDNYKTKLGLLLSKRYDTYAFSERYSSVPYKTQYQWSKFKTNLLMHVPRDKHYKKLVKEND